MYRATLTSIGTIHMANLTAPVSDDNIINFKDDTAVSETTALTELPQKGLLRFSQFKKFVGISKSTVWDWSTDGRFPAPVKLASNVTCWRASDIHNWLAEHGEV